VTVAHEKVSGQNFIHINEIQASNFSTVVDNDFSGFSDWIEIYNSGSTLVDLGGYFLTDDLEDIQKWQIPDGTNIMAGGYLLFWCDGQDVVLSENHTNFKLNGGGEEIGLFNPSLEIVDTVIFDDQIKDISFGRKPDGNSQLRYFAHPTPDAPNISQGYLSNEQAPDPEFSINSGFYNSSEELILSANGSINEIRFTTDGSQPNEDSEIYINPIPINSTKVIRARCFQNSILPGDIESQSYFIGEETILPVFSLVINPDFLWDPEIGIYVNEDIQNRRDWERGGFIEYYNDNHELEFDKWSNFRLFGNTAIFYPQKSLAVFPNNPLEYKLFESQETDLFHSFLLRSSSDDWPYTMLRDALLHSVIKDRFKIDHQAYNPSVFFINGEYFGIHNTREKLNERFLQTYHNIDPDNLDIIFIDIRDTTITALEGDLDEIDTTLNFIQNNDLSIDENYSAATDLIDIDNYIDFLIANLYYSNTSWHHNVKIWKEKNNSSKWQWLLCLGISSTILFFKESIIEIILFSSKVEFI